MHCFLYKTYTCYELKDPVYVTHVFLSLQCIGILTNSLIEKKAFFGIGDTLIQLCFMFRTANMGKTY